MYIYQNNKIEVTIMSHQSRFPINEPFYEVRHIKDFKDLIDQSEQLFSERPAYKLKNKDGVYYEDENGIYWRI